MPSETPELVSEVRESLKTLRNLHAYLAKHADKLPPMSLSSLEVRIDKSAAALAKAESR